MYTDPNHLRVHDPGKVEGNPVSVSYTHLDGVVDIGFGVLIQVDDLCVAAALEVEHAVVVPAVLVIADQQTLGIGGQGGLALSLIHI